MRITIYHNPKCSKSRQTLALIRENGHEPEIVDYVDQPPSQAELRRLCGLLGLTPRQLARTGEPAYAALGLERDELRDETILAALHANPVLIQRPIVVAGDKARIGRPPESVLDIIQQEENL